jgi:L-seryl-tRNA(Ser) seleniumtransferase
MSDHRQALFRKIPSVDILLGHSRIEASLSRQPRGIVIKAIHEVLEELRTTIQKSVDVSDLDFEIEGIVQKVMVRIGHLSMPSLRHVVNATGVVVHTNLGRSLLADRVLDKFWPLAGGYSNLEYSLEEGRRGSRYVHVEYMLERTDRRRGGNGGQ